MFQDKQGGDDEDDNFEEDGELATVIIVGVIVLATSGANK
jgi:hypothetical protein